MSRSVWSARRKPRVREKWSGLTRIQILDLATELVDGYRTGDDPEIADADIQLGDLMERTGWLHGLRAAGDDIKVESLGHTVHFARGLVRRTIPPGHAEHPGTDLAPVIAHFGWRAEYGGIVVGADRATQAMPVDRNLRPTDRKQEYLRAAQPQDLENAVRLASGLEPVRVAETDDRPPPRDW